jgi:HD superfamily phosphohydrolase YqeK
VQEDLVVAEVEEAEAAEDQLHGAVRVLMAEEVVEVEDQSSVSVVEGHIMLMRVRIGNNNDCIIYVGKQLKFHVVGVTTL